MPENASFQGWPKWVLPPQKEINSHIFKMAIFKKIFGDLMSHIIREYAGKKNKIFFECFTINNCEYTFVTFYGIQSLPWRLHRSVFRKNLVQWQFNPIHKYIATVPIHLTFGRGRERPKIMIGSFLYPRDSQICLKFDVVNPLFTSQNASIWTGWCGSVVGIGLPIWTSNKVTITDFTIYTWSTVWHWSLLKNTFDLSTR